MDIYFSNISITAPTREQLESVFHNPLLTSESFNKFYSILEEDDRQYMLEPEFVEGDNTNYIKVHTSTREDIPFSYLKALIDIEPSLTIDVSCYDGQDDEHPFRCMVKEEGVYPLLDWETD